MNPQSIYYEKLSATIIKNLNKRQMAGYYCPTTNEAVSLLLSLIPKNATITSGGSMSLEEADIRNALKLRSDITYLDRSTAASPEEVRHIYEQAFSCDAYLMSTNAITTQGELVNIDGNGNRVAALIYGPKEVLVLAGMNKVVSTVEEAISRVHQCATPKNCLRLNRQTPCAATGICSDCLSPDCICNQVVVTRRSGEAQRIKVILVGESLGY